MTLGVCVLDNGARPSPDVRQRHRPGGPGGLGSQGYLDGRALAELFAWLRPNDLIWSYVVNNYLLGQRPPAFDILFWNQDTAAWRRDCIETS